MTLTTLSSLLRTKQWVKNLLVFAPGVFAQRATETTVLIESSVAFVAFCFMASAIYCINDLIDKELDRMHPIKKLRPVASGAITEKNAVVVALCMAVASSAFCIVGGTILCAVLGAYLAINILYCIKLKNIPLIDTLVIATGFILRLFAGCANTSIRLSHWIIIATFLLALFLAFAKRRDDVTIRACSGTQPRKSLSGYNEKFIDVVLGVLAAAVIICYFMYSISPDVTTAIEFEYFYLTGLFVVAGVLRYLQIAIVENQSGSPTDVLLNDRMLVGCCVCWIASILVIYYLL